MNKYTSHYNLDQSNLSVPQFIDCGMILLKNVHEDDMTQEAPEDHPEIDDNTKLFGYYIIPQYDYSLEHFMQDSEFCPSVSEILEVGIQMVKSLKILHSVGYVHNDIKPGNVMINH